jgi:hypothetical protein
MRSEVACAAAACLLSAGLPAWAGEIVERILAVVDTRPVLLSETAVLQAVRGVDRAAALEALIDERLMYAEASRLPQSAVSAEEEDKALASLVGQAGGRAQGLAEEDLRTLARRETAILKYIHFRFLPQIRVDDAAVRRAYEAEIGTVPKPSAFEEEAPAIRQRLVDRELDQRIESWVKELRAGAAVRYNP